MSSGLTWISGNGTRANNIARDTTQVISQGISGLLTNEIDDTRSPAAPTPAYPCDGWWENDAAVLINDRRDLWRVDPDGVKPPINLTHGYGASHNIQFVRLPITVVEQRGCPSRIIPAGKPLLLAAMDHATKLNGFFSVQFEQGNRLKELVMEPRQYYFYRLGAHVLCCGAIVRPPVKAKNAETYLLFRQSESEYPNLYLTHDLRNFQAITNLAPQNNYNWYTTELQRWTLPDGRNAEGILFKPEDFDPAQKYPLIVYIYQEAADNLHAFLKPSASEGTLNIASVRKPRVSRFSFQTSVTISSVHPGQSACEGVESAIRHLELKPYVDGKHVGLQGHSFGGFETNYIVTCTDLFAAAAPASGVADYLSQTLEYSPGWYDYNESGARRPWCDVMAAA